MEKKKVCAVVVTYNRKALLLECVQAILRQSYPIEKIVIIDNASTDQTEEYLEENGILGKEQTDFVRFLYANSAVRDCLLHCAAIFVI